MRMLGEDCGTMCQEEVAGTETPEDADAGQTTIASGFDVNIAIAHIDGI